MNPFFPLFSVKVTVHSREVTVTGPRGTLKKDFGHAVVDVRLDSRKHQVHVEVWFGTRLQKSVIKSVCTHIENMIVGVTQVCAFSLSFLFSFIFLLYFFFSSLFSITHFIRRI